MSPSPNQSQQPGITHQAPFPEIVTATSLGQWPGTDPVEATKVSLGLLGSPHLPCLVDLPARGVGSDPIGRTAALLVELAVDMQPYGWRFVDRAGHDHRRAVSALSTDVNVLADVAGDSGITPPELKVCISGPVSLAAAIHLHYGERSLRDYGARRDIGQSLAAGLAIHAQKLGAAVPGAALTLQIDEPAVAAALAGTIPTASGYRTLRSIPVTELRQSWSALVGEARKAGFAKVAINLAPASASQDGSAGVEDASSARAESASWRVALETALECGMDALAIPLHILDTGHWEQLAGAIESGMGVWAGTVPGRSGQAPPSYAALVETVMRPWRGLGLNKSALNQLRITPETGLGTITAPEARAVLNRALEVAEELSVIRYQ